MKMTELFEIEGGFEMDNFTPKDGTSLPQATNRKTQLMETLLMRKYDAMEAEYAEILACEQRRKKAMLGRKKKIGKKKSTNSEFSHDNERLRYVIGEKGKDEYEMMKQVLEIVDTETITTLPSETTSNNQGKDSHSCEHGNDIELNEKSTDFIKSAMSEITLKCPPWAKDIPEHVWKEKLLKSIATTNDSDLAALHIHVTPHTQSTSSSEIK
ncbi:hypothetical protein RFI_15475 [Reticulomyxa filosa]|uniref:Uncharacterized protein n=1 Tax=Reticulomyxa filosa TaxID=46433 RepID=X6N8U8_RETFI|nr:hypothetical protein RFI_15475 [Reticulomyxa filosa]|eukprot:ETO21727.1 hypothetical protein RFI_15475 [Reticulomyxa filosa]